MEGQREFEGIQRMRAEPPEVWNTFKQGDKNKWKNRVSLSLSKINMPESKWMSKEAEKKSTAHFWDNREISRLLESFEDGLD